MKSKLLYSPQGLYTHFIVGLLILVPILGVLLQNRWELLFCLLPGCVFLILGATLLQSSKQTLSISAYSLLLTLFFVWFGLVGIWSSMPETHIYLFSYLLVWPVVYWLYLLLPQCDDYWPKLFVALCLIALVFGSITLYRYVVWQHLPNAYQAWFGEFKNKNMLAALCNLLALPLLAYFMAAHSKKIQKLSLLGFILLTLLLAFLGSRGAMLAFIIGLVFIQINLRYFASWRVWLLIWFYTIFLVFYSAFSSLVAPTSLGLFGLVAPHVAGESRLIIWHVAWLLIQQHPWFGTGLGSFFWLSMPYHSPLDNSTGLFVHNNYLQTWLAGGLPALFLLLVMMLALASMYWRFIKIHTANDSKKAEVIGLFAGIITVFFHGLFSYTLFVMVIVTVFALYTARLHCLLRT